MVRQDALVTDRELIEMRIELEFGVAPCGNTLRLDPLQDEQPPRLLISHADGGWYTYVRDDLPPDVRAELDRLNHSPARVDEALIRGILARHAPCEQVWHVRWYVFDRQPQPDEYAGVTARGEDYAIMIDGGVAARAWATKASACAVEVEVETALEYRRRGYARRVVSAWAADALSSGKVAYYSHVASNLASAGVARSLGLRRLSDEIEFV
jgi:hypothetical protein